ncbi:MAG: hypothetical protein ACK4M6_03455 [Hyphomonas sp.]
MTVLFWALSVIIVFAIVLAAQMRMIISVALRRALAAKFGGGPSDVEYRAAILSLGRGPATTDAEKHLEAEYPNPVGQLKLARRVSLAGPLALLIVVAIGRFGLGVF